MSGASAMIQLELTENHRLAFVDKLERIATVTAEAQQVFTAEQVQLLDLLSDGYTIDEAARLLSISARTAARRIAEARAVVGAPNIASLLSVRRRRRP